MKLTKLEHACLILDNGKSRLIIDPGSFTTLPKDLTGVGTLVVTEEHTDHFSLDNIQKILKQNPDVKIFSTEVVSNQLNENGITCEAIAGERQTSIDEFNLTFIEGDHAIVHGKSPCRVVTLQVDDFLYYPSDSYIPTDATVQVLALPTSGPWHKITESIDFANKINSKQILVTHNGLLSQAGNFVANNSISNHLENKNRDYIFLEVGESKEF